MGQDEEPIESNYLPQSAETTDKPTLSDEEIKIISQQARNFIKNHPPIITNVDYLGPDYSVENDYYPEALSIGRESIPPEVGLRFDAHGISEGNEQVDLENLNNLLTHGVDPEREFHTMQLNSGDSSGYGLGAANPYDDGGFIVIGHPDVLIRDDGIAAVLVNEHFEDSIPILQERFSEVKFIRSTQLPQALSEVFNLDSTS